MKPSEIVVGSRYANGNTIAEVVGEWTKNRDTPYEHRRIQYPEQIVIGGRYRTHGGDVLQVTGKRKTPNGRRVEVRFEYVSWTRPPYLPVPWLSLSAFIEVFASWIAERIA